MPGDGRSLRGRRRGRRVGGEVGGREEGGGEEDEEEADGPRTEEEGVVEVGWEDSSQNRSQTLRL